MATTDQNCFELKLQTSTKLHTGKTILENLTGDIDATIIKQIENYLLFNTSFQCGEYSHWPCMIPCDTEDSQCKEHVFNPQ